MLKFLNDRRELLSTVLLDNRNADSEYDNVNNMQLILVVVVYEQIVNRCNVVGKH